MLNTLEKKRTTIADIALRAGVTKTTVSMVFRNKEGISHTTRQRVMDIAKEMKYALFPVRQAQGKVHWGQIGFIIISKDYVPLNPNHPTPNFNFQYFSRMMHGCLACAEENGHSTVCSSLEWKHIKSGNLSSILKHERADGFLFRAWISPVVEEMLRKINVPVVLMDCDRYLEGYSSVHVNNIKGMDLVVEHLVKQGAKRFATITGNMDHQNAQERLAGLQMALTRRGIPLPPEGIITEPDFVDECGRHGTRKLIESGYRFDALVCHFDLAAYGAMEELSSAGIKVPDDVLVTGFDNEDFGDKIAIPLTTVETNSFQLGRLGAQLLLAQTSGEKKHIIHAYPEVSLVVRKSTQVQNMSS
ncbi:MAG: LacI family DNA-binding transcriptional regulator [Sedimentisphaerales bacterium]